MRYYRDLANGETLQAGDERLCVVLLTWSAIAETAIARQTTELRLYRRPVDLPVLQRVTPEAIAELEGDEIRTIAVLSQGSAKIMIWITELQRWHSNAGHDNPLEWHWFVDLATIPEVT